MTANINSINKPVMPEQAKPVLKAADHSSKKIKEEQSTVRSIETARAEKAKQESNVSKVNQTEDPKETEEEKQASEQSLNNAVKQLNSYVQSTNRNLEFNIDNDSGQTVIKVTDSETDELIRQIPNEEALYIAKQLTEGQGQDDVESGILLIQERA